MKLFLIIVVLALAGCWAAFRMDPDVRDAVRSWQCPDADRPAFDAYRQGRDLFKSTWEKTNGAKFQAWRDDAEETAGDVNGAVWLAHGHVTINEGGSEKVEPWCLAFDRASGKAIGRATGANAVDTIHRFTTGELAQDIAKPQQPAAAAAARPGAPPQLNVLRPPATPAPGSWMWSKEHHSVLDPPSRSKH